jgi:hypothetical protein
VRGQTLEGVGCLPSVGATRRVAPTSLWGEKYIPLEGEPPGEPIKYWGTPCRAPTDPLTRTLSPYKGARAFFATPSPLWGEGWGEGYIPLEGVGCLPSVGATRRVAPTSLWGEKCIPLEGEPLGEPLVREGGLRLSGNDFSRMSIPDFF